MSQRDLIEEIAAQINRSGGALTAAVEQLRDGTCVARVYGPHNARRRYADDTVRVHGDWFVWGGSSWDHSAPVRNIAGAARAVVGTVGKPRH